MATDLNISLSWSSPFRVAAASRATHNLPGDKILLPPSALEQLLSASTASVPASGPRTPFDPFNPYSLAQARQEASQWRDTQQQLPHPLTFRLVNPKNGNIVHAGIREFSAEEGTIGLSSFLLVALGVTEAPSTDGNGTADEFVEIGQEELGSADAPINVQSLDGALDKIVVHAKQLPKGTYVRLRPLEAGYNPDDWKSLLERHMRENFTTLTNGEILTVSEGRGKNAHEFRFLIDKFVPEGDGICVVDTDLEVDIEALNEEQARETLKQIMAKSHRAPGASNEASSVGGTLDIWKTLEGQVVPGEYVDYQLPSWNRLQGVEIELTKDDADEIDLFISPFSAHQRSKPREDEFVVSDVGSGKMTKTIRLEPTNIILENCEALYISVYGSTNADNDISPKSFSIRAKSLNTETKSEVIDLTSSPQRHGQDEEQCKNCHQWVPKRTMMLHENFCLRNNICCPHCEEVFKKNSSDWQDHWHCPHDTAHGNTPSSQIKHNNIFHTSYECTGCSLSAPSLPELASHRVTVCPAKLILCQFCHLEVPQEGDPLQPSAEQLMTGLTAHELADGSRTTNCHLCDAIVRLRDMSTHLKHHELSKASKPLPRICRNINCGRTLDGVGKNGEVGRNIRMGQGPGNELGLCSICFGPLYVNVYDPEGKAMKRRIERRYLGQLITGCGKTWCGNLYCKLGKVNAGAATKVEALSTKDALPMVKPLMVGIDDHREPMYFCVDEGSQKRRAVAGFLAADGIYDLEWCVAATEGANSSNPDMARRWLADWAPKKIRSEVGG